MNTQPTHPADTGADTRPWARALAFALPITVLMLGLVTLWFGVANRALVFLYYHDMGLDAPSTAPFGPVTRSRYWMTGCVAGGAVMVGIIAANWLLGRLSRTYAPPAWWRVWLLCAGPVAAGVLALTMTLNRPTLPFRLAAVTALAHLAGLALALQPAGWAARRPLALALLAADGGALALWLTTLTGLAYVPDWQAGGQTWAPVMLGVLLGVGVVGLAVTTGVRALLRRWLPPETPGPGVLLVAAACCAYLGLPLVHHVVATHGRFYITDMDNFFSRVPGVQVLTWAATAALAWGTTRLRAAPARRKARLVAGD